MGSFIPPLCKFCAQDPQQVQSVAEHGMDGATHAAAGRAGRALLLPTHQWSFGAGRSRIEPTPAAILRLRRRWGTATNRGTCVAVLCGGAIPGNRVYLCQWG